MSQNQRYARFRETSIRCRLFIYEIRVYTVLIRLRSLACGITESISNITIWIWLSSTVQAQPLGCIKTARQPKLSHKWSLILRGILFILHQFEDLHKLWDSPKVCIIMIVLKALRWESSPCIIYNSTLWCISRISGVFYLLSDNSYKFYSSNLPSYMMLSSP